MKRKVNSFRPQQGLTIMNIDLDSYNEWLLENKVSVPNRG